MIEMINPMLLDMRFNTMNSNDTGDMVARLFSDAHESETPSNLILEKQMELFNNNIGYSIGSNASLRYLNNLEYTGTFWRATNNSQLTPTNQ